MKQQVDQDMIELMTMQKERDMARLQVEKAKKQAKDNGLQLDLGEGSDCSYGSLIDAHIYETKKMKADLQKMEQDRNDIQTEYDKSLKAIEDDEALITDKNRTIESLQKQLKKYIGETGINRSISEGITEDDIDLGETFLKECEMIFSKEPKEAEMHAQIKEKETEFVDLLKKDEQQLGILQTISKNKEDELN